MDLDRIVVIDTNILQTTNLLRDHVSATFLFQLRRDDGTLGFPEPILFEWTEHWVEHCRTEYGVFRRKQAWISQQFGHPHTLEIDINSEARALIGARVNALGDLVEQFETKDDHWREAGEMVLEKRPPSSKGSQQYKDSLIWRVLLDMASDRSVLFVTADKAFFNGDSTNLEPTLAAEAGRLGADVVLARSLTDVMKSATTTLSQNELNSIEEAVVDEFVDVINGHLEDYEFTLRISRNFEGFTMDLFATETPQVVLVAVAFEAPADSVDSGAGETYMWVRTSGSALVDLDDYSDLDLELNEIDLIVSTPHYEEIRPLHEAPISRRRAQNLTLRIATSPPNN